ncbi:uncharacterized protein LOC135137931 [Zophobas morio]|uniref:uncharacterized protein LOC135137931 n=1 Tax=Zophobas morio TaxID=2755281 RepID=UPI003083623A
MTSREDECDDVSEISEEFHIQRPMKNPTIYIWNDASTKLFITLYEQHKICFDSKKCTNRSVWGQIAAEMQSHSYHVTIEQVENKWKNLKKQYKKIVDHNNSSGRDRADWPYFSAMDKLFGQRPEIKPPVLLGTMPTDKNVQDMPGTSETVQEKQPNNYKIRRNKRQRPCQQTSDEPTWLVDYKEQAERRHNEKMAIQAKLLEAVEKLSDKVEN